MSGELTLVTYAKVKITKPINITIKK